MNIIVNGEQYKVVNRNHQPFNIKDGKISGLIPEPNYTEELMNKFEDAWSSLLCQEDIERHQVLSSDDVTIYTVTRINNNYVCTCPARTECKHIKNIRREYEIRQARRNQTDSR